MWVWPSLQLLRTGKSHHFDTHIILLTSEMLKLPTPGEFSLILDHSTSHGLSQQLLGVSCSETYGSLTDESLGEENVFLITCSHTLFHSVFLKSSQASQNSTFSSLNSDFRNVRKASRPAIKYMRKMFVHHTVQSCDQLYTLLSESIWGFSGKYLSSF